MKLRPLQYTLLVCRAISGERTIVSTVEEPFYDAPLDFTTEYNL